MAKCIEAKYTNNSYIGTSQDGTGSYFVTESATIADPASVVAASALLIAPGAVQVAPTDGWRLTKLRLLNNSTVNTVSIFIGALYSSCKLIGVISVPENSGVDGTVAVVDALNTTLFPDMMVDNAGNKYIDIPAGMTIFLTTPAAADTIMAYAELYDYTA